MCTSDLLIYIKKWIIFKQVEKALESLTKEQKEGFAWRCEVRTLPFLGGIGNFNFGISELPPHHLSFSVDLKL